jgi:hypothetical protein
VTFAEQIPSIANRYARKTNRLAPAIRNAFMQVENPDLVWQLFWISHQPGYLLRLIGNAPEKSFKTPDVLGVDDWALRKGEPMEPFWWIWKPAGRGSLA